MSWIYQNKMFTDEHIPDGSVGFVYQMSAIINGKAVSYIGKKNQRRGRNLSLDRYDSEWKRWEEPKEKQGEAEIE